MMKNYFEHKGYTGTMEFSAEDKVFFGKVHGITDLVTFEGATVNELETAFKEAVDDYLEICRELGKNLIEFIKGLSMSGFPKNSMLKLQYWLPEKD